MALNDIKVPKENAQGTFDEITLPDATTSARGLLTSTDKTKLDGIASGATANTPSNATPAALGTAAAGTSANFSRADHVHAMPNASALLSTGAGLGDLPVAQGDGAVAWQTGSAWAGDNLSPADIGAAAATHASAHAAGGSDPVSPASIGAQSIFVTEDLGTITANVNLMAARAKIYTVVLNTFDTPSPFVQLPTTGIVAGDVVQIRFTSFTGRTLNIRRDGAGFTSMASGERRTFIAASTAANSWADAGIDTHEHAASAITSGTLDIARIPTGTGSTQVAAGNHTHELTALAATGAANGTILTANGAGGVSFAAASGGGVTTGNVDNAVLRADGTGGSTSQGSAFIIADNATASPNNTVNHASIQATGGTTNVSVSIVPKGTGAFSLHVPDAATAGGNVRGANAVDFQTSRSAATQVASGANAVLAGGTGNTASGTQSVVCGGSGNTASGFQSAILGGRSNTANSDRAVAFGDANTSSGTNSIAMGAINTASSPQTLAICSHSRADRLNLFAHGSGAFSTAGDAQRIHAVLRRVTTNATATELFLDGSTTRLTIPSGKVIAGIINCVGSRSDGITVAHYVREFSAKNVAGTSSLVGSVTTIGADTEDNASTDISVTVSDANDALTISVTGIASETWRWVASVDAVEVAYGT